MDIRFSTRKIEKTFNAQSALLKAYGLPMAKTIMRRMAVLRGARSLDQVPITPPERRHQLTEDRDEHYAVDLVHPKRLVFEVSHNPVPRKPDGGIDLKRVTAITILKIVDYH